MWSERERYIHIYIYIYRERDIERDNKLYFMFESYAAYACSPGAPPVVCFIMYVTVCVHVYIYIYIHMYTPYYIGTNLCCLLFFSGRT